MSRKETTLLSSFEQDVASGLSASPKHLSSKYFYDAKGSELFNQIMRVEEYYLTNCEFDIFSAEKESIRQAFIQPGGSFRLIEFGAGDGLKTKILLRHFLTCEVPFTYQPIDISGSALERLASDLLEELPELKVETVQGEYFSALHRIGNEVDERKIILFLGSNIGNFRRPEAITFLTEMAKGLSGNDLLFIGFDLKKNPYKILNAYNDQKGVTREFNMNLLDRMNRELGANFKREQFMHYPNYDPLTGETRSYLISKTKQEVYFPNLDKSFHFDAWEPIWMELSQKFDLTSIGSLAQDAGFEVVHNFFDTDKNFVNSLWKLR